MASSWEWRVEQIDGDFPQQMRKKRKQPGRRPLEPPTPEVERKAENSWQGADGRKVVSSRHGGDHESGRDQHGEDLGDAGAAHHGGEGRCACRGAARHERIRRRACAAAGEPRAVRRSVRPCHTAERLLSAKGGRAETGQGKTESWNTVEFAPP